MNYSKANDTSFSLIHSEQEDSNDNCNATNITEELDIDKPIKNKWAKYLDSPKKENPSDEEDPSFDICKVEDMITNEKSLDDAINKDSYNSKNTLDDYNFGSEDITSETKNLCSPHFNYNSNIEEKCNLQDSDETSKNHNAANIFETYSELDDPLI